MCAVKCVQVCKDKSCGLECLLCSTLRSWLSSCAQATWSCADGTVSSVCDSKAHVLLYLFKLRTKTYCIVMNDWQECGMDFICMFTFFKKKDTNKLFSLTDLAHYSFFFCETDHNTETLKHWVSAYIGTLLSIPILLRYCFFFPLEKLTIICLWKMV